MALIKDGWGIFLKLHLLLPRCCTIWHGVREVVTLRIRIAGYGKERVILVYGNLLDHHQNLSKLPNYH
jgi:hypothetical protein